MEKRFVHPAQWALKIIWFTGIICMVTVLFFFYNSSLYENDNNSPLVVAGSETGGVQSIDQLLLSSEEALLSDKKSFVNSALRFQWRNREPDLNQGNNRSILYSNILKKKLQRISKAPQSDFSVRPVPK
jgi:hypothetical protein